MLATQLLSPLFPNTYIPAVEIEKITQDSREASANALFICIAGANTDGHSYASRAYDAGCRLFLAEKALSVPADATVLITDDTRRAMGYLACRFYGDPSKQMRIIGITGTKGKTTTAQMLFQILNQNHISAGYIGTNGITFGKIHMETENTTPDSITLQYTLSQMREAGIETVIMEVSSQALKQHRVAGMAFACGIFTNLAPDHIGTHEHADLTEYISCKAKLFSDYGIRHMFLNADDRTSLYMQESSVADHILTYSIENASADYYGKSPTPNRRNGILGVDFQVLYKKTPTPVYLPMIGKINAYNALCAIAVAHALFGIPPADSAAVLSTVQIDGRSTQISLPNGATVVIDYAHNGESMLRILDALHSHHPKRLIGLFGSVGERSQGRRSEIGKAAASYCDLCILTSDNPGCEDPNQIMNDLALPLDAKGVPYVRIADREEAIRYGISLTESGDILLLAGKGHEKYQLIGKDKLPFCEEEIVSSTIADLLTKA